ncbi:hypothetical protein BGZ83_011002 [Gryganskiella cystojenkinii]|nr:hypothetical protein BGZ83_011002 [Gryganskiella cystojenkinii]
MSQPPSPTPAASRPKVLVAGGGIGGLALGLLLERAGVPYIIFERAATSKPLGSALVMGATVAYLFQQLGIYDEFVSQTLVSQKVTMRDENCNFDFIVDFSPLAALGGAEPRILSRPIIYELIRRQIPPEKILFNKRIFTIDNSSEGVKITCADGSVHEGDLLVGADGANSSVRQGLYQQLKNQGRLPSSDDADLPYNCISVVGQTEPLDEESFPELKDNKVCESNEMCGLSNKFTWITFTTMQRTICWMAVQYFDESKTKDQGTFHASDWGAEAAEAMCKEVRDFPIPNGPKGSTLGTLIDRTNKEHISKVTLEEKIFKTWYSGRTVLMGDACHKLSPSGGSGAVTAIHDAICLANWINILPAKTEVEDTERIFEEYFQERYPVAVEQFKKSQYYAATSAKTWTGAIVRIVQRRMPRWLWLIILKKTAVYRPQVAFLPSVEDKGTLPVVPQNSLIKTRAILASRNSSS